MARCSLLGVLLGCLRLSRVASEVRTCFPRATVPAKPFKGLKVHVDYWATSALSAHVAVILLRERLGFPDAELVRPPPGMNTQFIYEYIARGDAHLAFEVWPAGKEAALTNLSIPAVVTNYSLLYSTVDVYTRKQSAARSLDLRHLLQTGEGQARFSQYAISEGSEEAKQLCRSEEQYDCSADGIWRPSVVRAGLANCSAQLIRETPTYFKGYWENIIEALKVPVCVVYVGAQGLAEAVWQVSNGAPDMDMMFEWYQPAHRLLGIHVPEEFLPSRMRRAGDDSGFSVLHKVMWPGLLQHAIDAAAFMQVFELTQADFTSLTQWQWYDTSDPWAAACAWLKSNRSVWETWIQHPSRKGDEYRQYGIHRACFSTDTCVADFGEAGAFNGALGWWAFLVQLTLGIVLAVLHPFYRRLCGFCSVQGSFIDRVSVCLTNSERSSRYNVSLQEGSADVMRKELIKNIHAGYWGERLKHMQWIRNNPLRDKSAPSLFSSHVRTFANFTLLNSDPQLKKPPSSPLEVEGLYNSHLLRYLLIASCPEMLSTLFASLGIGLVCGAIGTYLWLLEAYQNFQDSLWGMQPSRQVYTGLIRPLASATSSMASDYKFFPTFAVLGLLGFFIDRWRRFFFASWKVEGRLKDLSMMLGAAVVNPSHPQAKAVLFRCYRFMCAALALQYKWLLPGIKDDPLGALQTLGLLTADEANVLDLARARDTLLTWVGTEATNGVRSGLLNNFAHNAFMMRMSECREHMTIFHHNDFYPVSNTWSSLVQISVDIWVCILMVGAPFKLYVQPTEDLGALCPLQPWVSCATFPVLFAYWGTLTVCDVLQRPFNFNIDTLNVDALVAGTEETIFANLRACFHLEASKATLDEPTAAPVKASVTPGACMESLASLSQRTHAGMRKIAQE